MKKNVGKVDKIVRYLLAAVLVVSGILLVETQLWLSVVFFVLAFIFVVTALIGFCGLYTLFGINTCKVKKEE